MKVAQEVGWPLANLLGWTNLNQGYKNIPALSESAHCPTPDCVNTITLCGVCITRAALGNIMYGITGASVGLTLAGIIYAATVVRLAGHKEVCQAKTDQYSMGWNLFRIGATTSTAAFCRSFRKLLKTFSATPNDCDFDASNCTPLCAEPPLSASTAFTRNDATCFSSTGGPKC